MQFPIFAQEFFEGLYEDEGMKIILFPETTVRIIKSIEAFYEFMISERDFWVPLDSAKVSEIANHFNNIVSNLEALKKNEDETFIRNNLGSAIHAAQSNEFPCVYSMTSLAQLIKARYNVHPKQADAICAYMFDRNVILSSREFFEGAMYSFFFANSNPETAAASAEKNSLLELHQSYNHELDKLNDKTKKIDSDYQEYFQNLNNWRELFQVTTDTFVKEKEVNLTSLEALYQEKLRLESPASYWNDLSVKYEIQGGKWRNWVIIVSSVFILFLSILLYVTPSSFFITDKVFNINSVKSSIIFLLISTVFVYVLTLFVRLATSSYHLARDAKERYQLTHVYLSLLNEKAIDEKERSIVLQSIFSRADTGLLKGDSSPTLPDSTLSMLIRGINGGKPG